MKNYLNREREYSLIQTPIGKYEEFYGRNIEQMPLLLAENRIPLSSAMYWKRRLEIANDKKVSPEVRSFWIEKYSDESDLIAYDSKQKGGRLKFVLTVDNKNEITEQGLTALKLINSQEERSYGAVVLGERYIELPGIEVSRDDFLSDTALTYNQILENKALRILSRHPDEVPSEFAEDKNLLKEYGEFVFAETKKRFGYTENMGVYLDQPNFSNLRALCLYGLGDRSGVGGGDYLGSGCGRFVWLAPKAPQKTSEAGPQKISREGLLEEKVQIALNAKKAFEYNGIFYVPFNDKGVSLK